MRYLIVVVLAFLAACANTLPLTDKQAVACAQEDCYLVPKSVLEKSAKELWDAGYEAGKKWL